MFHLIQNWKITDSSYKYIYAEWIITLKYDFNKEEIKKINSWYELKLTKVWMQKYFVNEEVEQQTKTPIKVEKDGVIENNFLVRTSKIVVKVEKEIEKYSVKLTQSDASFEIEKIKMIKDYKNNQKLIIETKTEIQEIDDTYETYNEQGKNIADKLKINLNAKLVEFRDKKDTMVLEGVNKYWEEVINEL